jgi:hypothetical protein
VSNLSWREASSQTAMRHAPHPCHTCALLRLVPPSPRRAASSVAEQGTHKPLVGSSILPLATTLGICINKGRIETVQPEPSASLWLICAPRSPYPPLDVIWTRYPRGVSSEPGKRDITQDVARTKNNQREYESLQESPVGRSNLESHRGDIKERPPGINTGEGPKGLGTYPQRKESTTISGTCSLTWETIRFRPKYRATTRRVHGRPRCRRAGRGTFGE